METRSMGGVGDMQLRIVEIGTLIKEGIAIIFARAQAALAGADPVAAIDRPVSEALQAFREAGERPIPAAIRRASSFVTRSINPRLTIPIHPWSVTEQTTARKGPLA